MDPFIGEIRLFAFQRVPYGWASCDGAQMQVNQNQALFSVIGNVFGGDGKTTFNLPDLRSRVPLGVGDGPGLTSRALGCTPGTTSVTLTASNFPAHTHAVQVNNGNATASTAARNFLANSVSGGSARPSSSPSYGSTTTGLANLATGEVSSAGEGGTTQNRDIRQPYLPVQLCIALYGIYPSRG